MNACHRPRRTTLFLCIFLTALAVLQLSPALAQPQGQAWQVDRISLDSVLGTASAQVIDARGLGPDAYLLSTRSADGTGMDLTVVHALHHAVIARQHIPEAAFMSAQWWSGGALHLELSDHMMDTIQLTVTPEGSISLEEHTEGELSMPGGNTLIRRSPDGSLYSVDKASGRETLLLQGVPTSEQEAGAYQKYRAYVLVPDDYGYDLTDDQGRALTHPVSEAVFQENEYMLSRAFHAFGPLDAQRFLYTVTGWEWCAGFGVYDLSTSTDHRITGSGCLFDRKGDRLFGSAVAADAATLETQPLPQPVQAALAAVTEMSDGNVDFAISPDGGLLAIAGMRSRDDSARDLSLLDIQTGALLGEYDTDVEDEREFRVSFLSSDRILLFPSPQEEGPEAMYILQLH